MSQTSQWQQNNIMVYQAAMLAFANDFLQYIMKINTQQKL